VRFCGALGKDPKWDQRHIDERRTTRKARASFKGHRGWVTWTKQTNSWLESTRRPPGRLAALVRRASYGIMFKFGGSAGRVRRTACWSRLWGRLARPTAARPVDGAAMGPSLRSSREVRCAVPCMHFISCPTANRRLLKLSGLALALSGATHARSLSGRQPESPLAGGPPHGPYVPVASFFGEHVTIIRPLRRYLARAAFNGPPGRLESNRRKTALRFVRTPWTCKAGSAAGL